MTLKSTFGTLSTQYTLQPTNLNPSSPSTYYGISSGASTLLAYGSNVTINDITFVGTDYYMCGTYSPDFGISHGITYAVLQKFNSSHVLVWQKFISYGDISLTNPTIEFDSVVYYGSYLYCFGGIGTTANPTLYPYGGLMVVFDTSGNLIAQYVIKNTGTISEVKSDGSGNFYGLVNNQKIIKITSGAAVTWFKQIPEYPVLGGYIFGTPTLYNLELDSSNNVIVAGYWNLSQGASNVDRGCIFKIDSSGAFVFQVYNTIGGISSSFGGGSKIYGLSLDSSDNIYISGINQYHQSPQVGYPGFIQRVSSAGALVWHHDYGPSSGSNQVTYRSSAIDRTNNFLYITGYNNKGIMTKIDTSGTLSYHVTLSVNSSYVPNIVYNTVLYNIVTPVMFTWPISGTSPDSTRNPLIVKEISTPTNIISDSSAGLTEYSMTGGANPGSYWRILTSAYTITDVGGAVVVVGALSLGTPSYVPTQFITNF